MGLRRFFPNIDTWITDAHPDYTINVRGTGSNHGESPNLNVFSRKGDISSGSIELARILVQFDLTELSNSIYSEGTIPSSSIEYKLKLFDEKHGDTLPTSYDLFVFPVSQSWDEGRGIDDDDFKDYGYASWIDATSTTAWTLSGSDFLTSSYGSASAHFDGGDENLEVDITDIVINWLTGALPNNGLVIKLGDTEETNGVDYYKKMFHARESMFVDRIPHLEVRWNDVVKDNRNNFIFDNSSKLYMYNFVRGELVDLSEPIIVRIQDHVVGGVSGSASFEQEFTASRETLGTYSVDLTIESTSSFSGTVWYDIWFSGSRVYSTGTFTPMIVTGSQTDPYDQFIVDVTNLKRVYNKDEEARLKVNVRKRDFQTHVLTSASLQMDREYIEKMYYSVINEDTGEVIIPYGTGSLVHTQLSYNSEGNYFNLWMGSFVPGFLYRLQFLIDVNRFDKKIVNDEDYIFKVV